jgi:hypothetical protein
LRLFVPGAPGCVRGHQVHAPGLQADPVGDSPGRPRAGQGRSPVHPPAGTGHLVQIMLDDRRGQLGDLDLLIPRRLLWKHIEPG